ncbi:hypothetical protein PG993_011068 [Apiospora rasikravindrae]|uniref:Protein kinase domain-containing protein n=1 Tax=Apiospora rasikravindrae TaxID=990691 RepID=A0ABR1SD58_9PEZI
MSHPTAATADSEDTRTSTAAIESENGGRVPSRSIVQSLTTHDSTDLSSATSSFLFVAPSPPQVVVHGDDGPGSETMYQFASLDISSDDADTSNRERDDSEDDRRSSTEFTSPASQSSRTSLHRERGPDYELLGTTGITFNPRMRNTLSDSPGASTAPQQEGRVLFRETIKGLKPTDYKKGAPKKGTPTVISDFGTQQFKQSHENNSPVTSISASHETLETRLFAARHLARHPHSEAWTQDEGFIPKKQLEDIITEDSVFQELYPHFSKRFYTDEIRKFASYICRDTCVLLADGRFKLKSFKPIFALLAMFDRTSEILEFLEEDVSDLDLPLVKVNNGRDGRYRIGRRTRSFKSGEDEGTPLRCFSKWNRINCETFLRYYQWMMLSPFFKESDYNDIQHYELHNSHILPWTNESEDEYKEVNGGFATVFPVRIHEEHHNFADSEACKRGFAIKQLLDKSPKKFKREVKILQKFVGHNAHPHIVALLATYRHCGKYHMIFYRAQGDLFRYWSEINPTPTFNQDTILWVVKQCKGIADGLVLLHRHHTFSESEMDDLETPRAPGPTQSVYMGIRETAHRKYATRKQHSLNNTDLDLVGDPKGCKRLEDDLAVSSGRHDRKGQLQFGRHGDLKPENILWFEGCEGDRGTLKIADFGQAELHEWKSKTRKLSEVADTMAYRSPESHLDDNRFKQSSDVWSLGCVFLVFVTWTLGGAELVMKFARIRSARDEYWGVKSDAFFEMRRLTDATDKWTVTVKPSVVEFIHQLHMHTKCSAFIHDILDLIYTKMLVIEISSSNERISCVEVHRELTELYKECCKSKEYATAPKPWIVEDSIPPHSAPAHLPTPTSRAQEFAV